MAGGGGSDPKPQEAAKVVNKVQPGKTVDPFMPGMDSAIAAQLAAGYGGNPADYLASMMQYYAPMQIPSYSGANSGGATNGGAANGGAAGANSGGGQMTREERAQSLLDPNLASFFQSIGVPLPKPPFMR